MFINLFYNWIYIIFICNYIKKMNEEQLKFLKEHPYLIRAFEQVTEEDKEYMNTLNAEKVTKEQVKKLQDICRKMVKKMTFIEKIHFGRDLMTLIKLWWEKKI